MQSVIDLSDNGNDLLRFKIIVIGLILVIYYYYYYLRLKK
jgi:hypothetical protein